MHQPNDLFMRLSFISLKYFDKKAEKRIFLVESITTEMFLVSLLDVSSLSKLSIRLSMKKGIGGTPESDEPNFHTHQ